MHKKLNLPKKICKTCKTGKIDDMACIEIYQPVCGCNNETYSNSCYAEVDGVTSWSEGECSG